MRTNAINLNLQIGQVIIENDLQIFKLTSTSNDRWKENVQSVIYC